MKLSFNIYYLLFFIVFQSILGCNISETKKLENFAPTKNKISSLIISKNFNEADKLIQINKQKFGATDIRQIQCLLLTGELALEKDENEKALKIYDSAKKTITKKEHTILKYEIFEKIAQCYLKLNEKDEAQNIYDSIKILAETEKNRKKIAAAIIYKSYANYFNGKNDSINKVNRENGLKIAKKENDSVIIVQAYFIKGIEALDQQYFDSASALFSTVINYATNIKSYRFKSAALMNKGYIFQMQGKNTQSINHYKAGLEISLELNNQLNCMMCYFNLGNLFSEMNSYKEAKNYYLKSYELSKNIKNDVIEYNSAVSLAFISTLDSNYTLIKKYNTDAEKLAANLSNLEKSKSTLNWAKYYSLINNIPEAAIYFKKAITYNDSINNENDRANVLIEASKFYNKIKDKKNATKCGTKGLAIALKTNNNTIIANAYNVVFNAYKENGDFSMASHYAEKYNTLKDSIYNNEKAVEIGKKAAEIEFEKEKIEKTIEIKYLNEQINLKNKNKNLYIFTSLFLLVATLLFIYLYFQLRKTKTILNEYNNHLAIKNNTINKQNIELKDSNENLLNFATMAAHDINAPLYSIRNLASIIQKKHAPTFNDKDKEAINLIIEGCHNLAQMINGLLQFSSITKNLPPVNKIDLNKLIPNILEDINHSINTSEVKINVNANLPTVLAHESLLKQVFLNLITNSIKYKKENKEVTIEIGYKDTNYNFVELFVKDDGIGIPTEFQGKIFDLFKKFHASTNIEGNGVGLGTCKKIINFYNGKIWVESENQKGTIIYFTLQVA